MATVNSMVDKVFGAGQSKKARKTLHLQRNREKKTAQERPKLAESVGIDSNWRVASKLPPRT